LELEAPKLTLNAIEKCLQTQVLLKIDKKSELIEEEKKLLKKHRTTERKRKDEPTIKSYKTKRWTLQ